MNRALNMGAGVSTHRQMSSLHSAMELTVGRKSGVQLSNTESYLILGFSLGFGIATK